MPCNSEGEGRLCLAIGSVQKTLSDVPTSYRGTGTEEAPASMQSLRLRKRTISRHQAACRKKRFLLE